MTAPITPKDLEALKAAAETATPGPWQLWTAADARPHQVSGPTSWRPYGATTAVIVDVPHYGHDAPEASDEQAANARFIALANPAFILAIFSDRDRLLAIIAEKDGALDEIIALPEMSKNPVDDFDRGARAARLDAADMAKTARAIK